MLKHLLFCLFLIIANINAAKAEAFENANIENINASAYFDGLQGCLVMYNPEINTIYIYNEDIANTQASPFSTFKIVATLLGLENNVLTSTASTMFYDGTQYWTDYWNKNVSLLEAFKYSCVWFFHQVVYSLEQEQVQNFLSNLSYGNADISEWEGNGSNPIKNLNGFWLNSSLKIAPIEQVRIVSDIFMGKTNINQDYISILRECMQLEDSNIYGKTGSNMQGKSWFVGFTEQEDATIYFAVYVDDVQGGVSQAKEIALEFFKEND